MMYYLFPLCAVTAVMWVPVTYAKWDDYNPGSGGIKWLPNCDYPGFDIASEPITAEQCGRACIDTVGCNAFSWHDGWCFLKRKPVNVHRSPLLVGGRCGFLPWEFDETSIIQTNNFANSVVNTISQVNPQQTNYPLNSPINQRQFSPRKSQITPQRNVQLELFGKLNIPSILIGKLNSPNHNKMNKGYSNSYPDHSEDDDEDYGSHQEEDYHRDDVIDDEGSQLELDGINDGDNQPAEDIETEDNQLEEIEGEDSQPSDVNDGDNQPGDIDDENNQLDDITDDDNNQLGDGDYDDDQPGDGDYEDN
jgi:hypothetical protein